MCEQRMYVGPHRQSGQIKSGTLQINPPFPVVNRDIGIRSPSARKYGSGHSITTEECGGVTKIATDLTCTVGVDFNHDLP